MRIINAVAKEDIEQGSPVRLNLGAGLTKRANFYSVDHLELDGVDIVADLNKPLDMLPDNSVEYIYSRHTLEHINELLPLFRELYRITKPGGTIEIIVPHYTNPYYYSDPTHVRFFGLNTMFYFVDPEKQPVKRKVPTFYSDVRFEVESVEIEFYRLSLFDRLFVPFFSRLVNKNIAWQDFYERRLAGLYHAWQLRYVMHPDK